MLRARTEFNKICLHLLLVAYYSFLLQRSLPPKVTILYVQDYVIYTNLKGGEDEAEAKGGNQSTSSWSRREREAEAQRVSRY